VEQISAKLKPFYAACPFTNFCQMLSLISIFLASLFSLQIILSVVLLLFEISSSKSSWYQKKRNNVDIPALSRAHKFTFIYQSKCGDLRNARKHFNLFQNALLCDEDLMIYSDACDNHDNELVISLKFELNNLEKIGDIVAQFDEFKVYLDGISIK
jgi:hypothetical protein